VSVATARRSTRRGLARDPNATDIDTAQLDLPTGDKQCASECESRPLLRTRLTWYNRERRHSTLGSITSACAHQSRMEQRGTTSVRRPMKSDSGMLPNNR
jgi:hypothetical protein